MQILRGLKSRFEEHHNVRYSAAALSAAAELSARYINDRHLPDKAIDVIDEAGAAQRLLPRSRQKKVIGRARSSTSFPRSRASRRSRCPTTTAASWPRWTAISRPWCSARTRPSAR